MNLDLMEPQLYFLRIGLRLLEQAMEQHHRAAEEGGQLWESCGPRSARAGCSKMFPVIFWISPQHLNTTCSTTPTIKMCFVIFKGNFLFFNLYPLLLVTGQDSEPPLFLFFTLLFSCFHASKSSLWAFSSLCWMVSSLWKSPCINDVSLLYPSLWSSTGLTPPSLFSWTKLHMPGVASPARKEESCQLLRPAGSSVPTTAQHAAGHLCCKGTLLAHSQLFAHKNIQVLLWQYSCPCEGWCLQLFLLCWVPWGSSLPLPPDQGAVDGSTLQGWISPCSCSVPPANWLVGHSIPESCHLWW